MVEAGEWSTGQDKVLVTALKAAVDGGQQEWEVDWDALVPGRTLIQVWLISCYSLGKMCVLRRGDGLFINARWWVVVVEDSRSGRWTGSELVPGRIHWCRQGVYFVGVLC